MIHSDILAPHRSLLVCDRIITGGIVFLLFFTPLAFGAVHPWAFSAMEAMIFLLVVVWMMASMVAPSVYRKKIAAWPLLLLLLLFTSVLLLQLLPLSPSLLKLISPATYALYTRSLPGWPASPPYENLLSQTPQQNTGVQPAPSPPWVALPTPGEVGEGTPVPLAKNPDSAEWENNAPATAPSLASLWYPWRSLSVAPSLTWGDGLKFFSYVSLFLLVLFYPFAAAPKGEEKFFRTVLFAVLVVGVLVASIGMAQRFAGNGKILWFFVPYDWGSASSNDLQRASGPFINPNHFANYLALILPLAVTGVLSVRLFVAQEKGLAFRVFSGVVAFVLLVAILLSLSRGAWVSVAFELVGLFGIFLLLPKEKRPSLLSRSRMAVLRFGIVGATLFSMLALFVVGSSGRNQVDVRLEQTVMSEGRLADRLPLWQDSLKMAQEFPLFGVGLGAWPDLFPHYERPPWSPIFSREVHNDYLELLAETGVVGFSFLSGFFIVAAGILLRGLRRLTSRLLPVFVALVVAMGGMALHEWVDFNLQIPANALLCTLLLGLALRMARTGEGATSVRKPSPVLSRLLAGTGGIVAGVLCLSALRHDPLPYPYNRREARSVAEAQAQILAHSSQASAHLALFRLLQAQASLAQRVPILETAVWLDPKDPRVRDLYAVSLFQLGREEEGLKEITRSVSFSPLFASHSYLNLRLLPWLSVKEQQAIEDGFRQATADGNEDAVIGLGIFYDTLGRFAEEGELYEGAGLTGKEPSRQVSYLLNAGLAYARTEKKEKAEEVLRRAITVAPQESWAYHYLATQVFAPGGDVTAAKTLVAEGLKNGAEPFSLYFSLGEAARIAKNLEEAKIAFMQALTFRPSSFDAHLQLGLVYLQGNNFERAVLSFQKAVNLNSASPLAFFYLGLAEESRFQLLAAKNAYARAATLDPGDLGLREHYEAFLQKVTQK